MTDTELASIMRSAGIIPIVTVESVERGMALTDTLVEAGVTAVEIVLRTPAAYETILACRRRHPRLLVGAGTVLDAGRYDRAVEAQAQFAVSPGLTRKLGQHAKSGPIPLIPGALTASEVMNAMEDGFSLLKYYPAEPSNGSVVLADYAHVFPDMLFMPTGKIGPAVLGAYARLRNVLCCGGSWMFADGANRRPAQDIARLVAEGRSLFATTTSPGRTTFEAS